MSDGEQATTPATDAAEAERAVPAPPAVEAAGPWGRVAADGTVYVRRADGEQEIGNWAAGTPADGLASLTRDREADS